jgi:hypothetical protein
VRAAKTAESNAQACQDEKVSGFMKGLSRKPSLPATNAKRLRKGAQRRRDPALLL